MSVLACSRRCCSNIMCDRYSYTYGYICSRCFREMQEKRVQDIYAFMNTPPSQGYPERELNYEDIFPLRD